MTEKDAELIAKKVAEEIQKGMCRCGLNHELMQYHEGDHVFIGEIRKGIRLGTKIGIGTLITVVTGSAITAFGYGIRHMLSGGK
ncbi:MAG: hypothetical protein AB7F25_07120 [Deferribacterales bacterium]